MEHFTKAKLTHIFWQKPLESCDIPRLFRRSAQFLFKTVFLFLDKRKKYTNPTAAVFLPIAYGIESCFLFRDPESTPTYFTFSAVLPLDTALHRRMPLPFPATLRRVPPCKCRPKCPIFAARSAAKDSATRDSCPLLGKSASSHPHFLQIVLLNGYVTGSMFVLSCNDAKIRQIPPIYQSSLLTGP